MRTFDTLIFHYYTSMFVKRVVRLECWLMCWFMLGFVILNVLWTREIHYIVDVDQLRFILQPNKAHTSANGSLIEAFVISAPQHFERRSTIRSTWANTTLFPQIQTVFMLGVASQPDINRKLEEEALKYNDIVQADFMDTYYNLTLKTLMGLKWMAANKHDQTPFVLKIDDDVVVNSFQLVPFLNNYLATNRAKMPENKLICKSWPRAVVTRQKSSKFYIADDEYRQDYFPQYCDGPAYIMSAEMSEKLYEMGTSDEFRRLFKFEDIFIGMLADKLNSTFVDLTPRYLTKPADVPDLVSLHHFFAYSFNAETASSLWNYFWQHAIAIAIANKTTPSLHNQTLTITYEFM